MRNYAKHAWGIWDGQDCPSGGQGGCTRLFEKLQTDGSLPETEPTLKAATRDHKGSPSAARLNEPRCSTQTLSPGPVVGTGHRAPNPPPAPSQAVVSEIPALFCNLRSQQSLACMRRNYQSSARLWMKGACWLIFKSFLCPPPRKHATCSGGIKPQLILQLTV